jgi:hypothetical protein
MIDYMKLHPAEAERLCYAEGFTNAAQLFARLADAEKAAEFWQDRAEDAIQEAIEANAECENLRMQLQMEQSK